MAISLSIWVCSCHTRGNGADSHLGTWAFGSLSVCCSALNSAVRMAVPCETITEVLSMEDLSFFFPLKDLPYELRIYCKSDFEKVSIENVIGENSRDRL